ncbi:MAG: DUF898 family protein [bacterium]
MSEPEIAPRQGRLTHHGRGRELLYISLINLLLRLVTLGIYHFWGKTRVRRYLWSQTGFAGERFEYSGRGWELLRGFALAMLAIVPPAALWGWLQVLLAERPLPLTLINLAFYAGLAFLTGLATFSARRYLLSRTRLRGIRFALSGSAVAHGKKLLGYTVLVGLTFGFYTPYMRNHLMAHIVENTWFGSQRASYSGDGKGLFRKYLRAGLLSLAVVVVLGAVTAAAVFWFLLGGGTPFDLVGGLGTVLLLQLLVPLLLFGSIGVIWLWYRGEELRYFAAHTRVGPLSLEVDYSGSRYVKFQLLNLLLLAVTAGLAFPFVAVRVARFAADHLKVSGELDFAAIAQSTEQMPAGGEGLAEAFDLGAI